MCYNHAFHDLRDMTASGNKLACLIRQIYVSYVSVQAPLTSCVVWGKLLHVSVHLFPYLSQTAVPA